ncbi:MAG: NAD(P)/FAD-dependent oxidoreductase [Phycisphaerales bacterium]
MNTESSHQWDVAIIGGGPTGTTAASLLKKYNPDLSVLILEKAKFPRDHIGESQLPTIGPILDEMGVWEKVEAAGFPVKIGASYTWGRDQDRWNFDFLPVESWQDQPRPAKFEGLRRQTAFQVDRAILDNILLRHAESMGTEVREQTQVREVLSTGSRIDGLRLDSGDTITARYYIDASGAPAVLRRALDVPVWSPKELKNIAFWDYWQNAEWAVEIGAGATRIQIRSLPYGWIWFIPIGTTRTSIGLVVPAEWYKQSGQTPQDIYKQAVADQPEIAALIKNATPENKFETCKDWSNLAEQPIGENWFLAGESAGFADPILSAGMTLAHTSAREAAYSILELDRAELDPEWIRDRYATRVREGIRNHIRFAQFWYASNGCFTELKDHCANIAKEAGLGFTPEKAWRWLSLGGFTHEIVGSASLGSFGVTHTKRMVEFFDSDGRKCPSLADGYNVFKLNLRGAQEGHVGSLENGRIHQIPCYRRADKMLPVSGVFELLLDWLSQTDDARTLADLIQRYATGRFGGAQSAAFTSGCYEALEVMVQDLWVIRSKNKKRPVLNLSHDNSRVVRKSKDETAALESLANPPKMIDRMQQEQNQ